MKFYQDRLHEEDKNRSKEHQEVILQNPTNKEDFTSIEVITETFFTNKSPRKLRQRVDRDQAILSPLYKKVIEKTCGITGLTKCV